jgi:hypothetical protein
MTDPRPLPFDDRLLVKWNLARLAADLGAHLESIGDDSVENCEEFLEPYRLTPDEENTVVRLAWNSQCRDCGDVFDHYVVHDEAWEQAGLKWEEYCCRTCLALRLKRPLRRDDFKPCPLNCKQGLCCAPAPSSPATRYLTEEPGFWESCLKEAQGRVFWDLMREEMDQAFPGWREAWDGKRSETRSRNTRPIGEDS